MSLKTEDPWPLYVVFMWFKLFWVILKAKEGSGESDFQLLLPG